MLIPPERYQPKVLMPVRQGQWRTPSAALPKDMFGREDRTAFRITGRLDDGALRFIAWFEDRDDADAYLHSLMRWCFEDTPMPLEELRMPASTWGDPLGEGLSYEFATVVILSASTGSNQTYTSPLDWNNANNSIESIGGGGSGACTIIVSNQHAVGGGGGEWRKIANFSFASPGTTTAIYQIAALAAGKVNTTTSSGVPGNAGNPSWFDGTTFAGASLAANGATAAPVNSLTGGIGGTGGTGAGGNFNGGRGGNSTGGAYATGGGAAAGPNGVGLNGGDLAGTGVSAGGKGDNGSGGSGSAGVTGVSPQTSAAGNAGAEYATAGSGGGSGGARATSNGSATSGAGGNYGAGSGGAAIQNGAGGNTATSGAGAQGLIVLAYAAATAKGQPVFRGNRSLRFFRKAA